MCRCRNWIVCAVIVCVLAWVFEIFPWMWYLRRTDPPPVSYDGRIIFNSRNPVYPTTEEEIVATVTDAYQNGRKVRVLSAGHSWSEIAQTEDIMISLHEYKGLVSLDEQNLQMTVRAGTKLSEMTELLEESGLAMINLGSVSRQSIAGAISTGTHGTGLTVGNLGALVTKLKFVSGTGKVITVSKIEQPNVFKAAQVSIGMLGVLSEVTIRVERAFKLKELLTTHDLDYCMDNFDKLVQEDGYRYVKMWVEFYHNFCILFQTDETEDAIGGMPGAVENFITYYLFAITTRLTYLFPSWTPAMMWIVNTFGFWKDTETVDVSYKIFEEHYPLPIHAESEIYVHYNDTVPAIRAIQQAVVSQGIPVNYITEVRWVEGDDIWLSPDYMMYPGTCAITLNIYARKERVDAFYEAAYQATKDYNPRFHWGKHIPVGPTELRLVYEKFDDFAGIRKRFDPKGIFLNNYLKEKFGFSEEN